MCKLKFWVLNLTSLILVVLFGLQFWLGRKVQALNNQMVQSQAVVNNAQQIEPILRKLSMRIAQGSEREPRMRDLLVKYGMKVTLNVDGKQKSYP